MTAVLVILGVIALGLLVGWWMSKVIDQPYEDADIATRKDTPVQIHLTDVYQPPVVESAEDKRLRLYKDHVDELDGKKMIAGMPKDEYMRQWYVKNRKTIIAQRREKKARDKAAKLEQELSILKGQQAINNTTTPAIPTQQAYSPEFGYGAGVKD